MSDEQHAPSAAEVFASTPMRHWYVSGAGLIWNFFGLAVFHMTQSATPEQMAAQYSPAQVAYIENIPIWATAANGIAVVAGVIACVLLLLRKAVAVPTFVVSLLALLVQDFHDFVVEDVVAVFGPIPAYIQGTVFVVAIILLLYARSAKKSGLLT